ncbi:hypothetical protein [Microcoleus sp. OTE_8_concoct_300]|uniref:hypothetical protein n=1 Tax=Microcoleus sp. OTE_8_concoct_300 TaxID=2964710 RepID=UPI00403F48FB
MSGCHATLICDTNNYESLTQIFDRFLCPKVKQSESEEFHKALAYFDLEIVNLTETSGYEHRRGNVYAIQKKYEKFRVRCVYSSYNQLRAWGKRQFLDKKTHPCSEPGRESEAS